ncbi:MAG TPA: type II toxin-antitoxin system VapC family toxin [Gaiellaceae bacterium]
MASILLDTTVLIDLLRGKPAAAERLRGLQRGGDLVWTSVVNVEEIARGLRPGEEQPAQRLLSGLRLAPLDEAEGWRAGTWRRDFAARGITLAQADCLVAAAALGVGGRLATGNPRHFPMPELAVEHWQPGG